MSATDIQNFLNGFPNSCLKNYTDDMPSADPTRAYFDYLGTGSAAQIIRRVADNYGINPRVLLTKLEQESSLVSGGSGCALWRQASAVGFKCYDGANLRTTVFRGTTIQTCVATDADMGVARQLSRGGWLLKWAKERANGNLNWLVPDDAAYTYNGPMTQGNKKRCGTCSTIYYDGYWNGVYLESGATASLYNYTPYLNQAFDEIWEGWWGAGSTVGANYSWSMVSWSANKNISNIGPGESIQINVTVKNTGNRIWSNISNPVSIGTWNPTDRRSVFYDSTWVSVGRPAVLNELTVAPGANGNFSFVMKAPLQSGVYNERFNLVADGITWFPDLGYTIAITVKPLQPAATVVSQNIPSAMTAGSTATVTAVIRNDSNATWRQGDLLRLATATPRDRTSIFQGAGWVGANRITGIQETSVSPGQNGTFVYNLKAPAVNGTYNEQFGLVQDGVAWYPTTFGGNIIVTGGSNVASVPVTRLYNGRSHFYAGTDASKNAAISGGFRVEGVEFYAYPSQISGTVPVTRLYNGFSHFYAGTDASKNAAIAGGFRVEGVEFYAYPSQISGTVPVYRLYNGRSHFYAGSEGSRSAASSGGFRLEGIEFYGLSQ